MTRAVLLVLLILSVAWLAQSGDGDEMQCPDKDANFLLNPSTRILTNIHQKPVKP